jgi:GT2 family glycosyltransferase
MNKIGLTLISYDRPDFLRQSLDSLEGSQWGGAHHKAVILDEPFSEKKYGWLRGYEHISVLYKENQGVAVTKNMAITSMIQNGCSDLFIMEDDILMVDLHTCTKYLDYAEAMQVPHLNFALHGDLNKGQKRMKVWQRINQQDKVVCVYPHCVGAFSYYSKDIILRVGLIDENFKNSWDHVEHTWRISQTGMIPPFWYFMDHPESYSLLREQPESISASVIRKDPAWNAKVEAGRAYWISKHGAFLPPMPYWV